MMRVAAMVLGGVLLLGGGALVVVADQQRVAAVQSAKDAVDDARERLAATRAANLDLADRLTGLRAEIAEQENQLADVTGLLP
ncbi:hypothetical protein [Microbacterium sp.]|uniref:hypothetical protein n=1 Tax=Microbacterium sp. TaxID=51671 RepID=UPI0039E60C72